MRLDDEDHKSAEPEITYPYIYFAVCDFDCAWKDIALYRENQVICVELFGNGDIYSRNSKSKQKRMRLFAGALSFEIIKAQYRNRKFQLSFASTQFFKLMGPMGKGSAQMAVTSQNMSKVEIENDKEANSASTPTKVDSPHTSSWRDGFSKVGSLVKNVVTAPINLVTSPGSPSTKLNCSLTFLNIRWDLLSKDILDKSSS
eukprot:TRINITY_DN2577_c0_g1_i2.p1 TRINITY_DN2577_c0_g1~~TRINITY_DN2577_c0_g1_i2.p1  ORF type:complete len:201 (+),score=61.53 TRINITY_DN2577_c0_g1_i2:327-929(+)